MADSFDIEQAIVRFNLDNYLRRNGIDFRITVTGEYNMQCPRCHRNKLYCNGRTKLFICHRCPNFRGNLVFLVSELEGISRYSAMQLIIDLSQNAPAPVARVVKLGHDCEFPEYFHLLDDRDNSKQWPYWQYFERRGFDSSLVKRYSLGYCRIGMYAQRLIVPVLQGNTLVSWIARDITGKAKKKVFTPTGNNQGNTLFNIDAVLGGEEVVICEGVFDALRLPTRCVATFGKHITDDQRLILQQSGIKRVTISWDSDAWLEAVQAANRMSLSFDEVKVAKLKEKDPADMSQVEFEECLEMAMRVDSVDLALARMVTK